MPAHRKPTELLELSGVFQRNPNRRRPVEPKSPHPVGEPHPSMAEDKRACWREFVSDAPAGVLTSGDRWALERLCCLQAKSRRGQPRRPRRTLGTWRRRAGPRRG